jgi:23S rRNA pseudouridine2605 synthase
MAEKDSTSGGDSGIRLQKVLAQAGIASRRASEELILAGRVTVDGEVVRQLGTRVDPERQRVAVDGVPAIVSPDRVYLVLNKPRGMVSTMSDERGRPCVGDVVPGERRLFHVGRLDADSEGLLLLTDDGELAQHLLHPSHGVTKTYLTEVSGSPSRAALRDLRQGVELDDGPAHVLSVRALDRAPGRTLLEVVVAEGRTRLVRRLLEAVGHPVTRLVRTRIGPLDLGDLRPGRTRRLRPDEVRRLWGESR